MTKAYMKAWREKHKVRLKAYQKEWREANRDKVRAAQKRFSKKRYKERLAWTWELKNVPCADCRKKYHPMVMEFDHVRGMKKFTISNKLKGQPLGSLKKEIAKCDVVCANCHRVREAKRKGYM